MSRPYKIFFRKQARKQLLEIPEPYRHRVSGRIDGLKSNPRPSGVEKIRGFEDHYRIRIGPYRVVYMIQDYKLIIEVIRIGARKDVYRKL